jgi:ribosomal protein S18 acetylase RimI-like enzyme
MCDVRVTASYRKCNGNSILPGGRRLHQWPFGTFRACDDEPVAITFERDPPADEVRPLFAEYAASLSFDLSFQGFDDELAGLPGDYAPPTGALLLARVDGEPAGCVALRALDGGTGELKRLFVRPAHRGLGLGRKLVEQALDAAADLGYDAIRLDTTPEMRAAHQLYRTLGFREIEPYRENPVAGARYLELDLRP